MIGVRGYVETVDIVFPSICINGKYFKLNGIDEVSQPRYSMMFNKNHIDRILLNLDSIPVAHASPQEAHYIRTIYTEVKKIAEEKTLKS